MFDLRDLTLGATERRRVVAKVGTGQLTVIVPDALSADVRARMGAGSANLFGRAEGGPGVDVTSTRPGPEGGGRLALDLEVGVGEIGVEEAAEPTYDVTCQVPAEAEVKGDGTDPVRCPHPARLARKPMTCSVALMVGPGSGSGGQAFCRAQGDAPPKVGAYGVVCQVAAASDEATCLPLSAAQMKELQGLRESIDAAGSREPGAAPAPGPAPTTTAVLDRAALRCGPPDATTGERLCAPAPASSTTTAAAGTLRCREDPGTKELSCVPA